MKFISMRTLLAMALALVLAACGGGKATFTVGGYVSGLVYNGLVLSTNGQTTSVAPAATIATDPNATATFTFPKQLEYGDEYDVIVATQPAHQTCTVSTWYQHDTAGRLATIDIPVSCTMNAFLIGGTISGLTADGLVLTNGSTGGTFSAASGATVFTMPTTVVYGTTYGVTVLKQPTGLFCSVSNGAGTMGDASVTSIAVTCVPAS